MTFDPNFNQITSASLESYQFANSPYYYLFITLIGIVALIVIVKFAAVIIKATITGGIAAIAGVIILLLSDSFLKGIIEIPISTLIPVVWAGTGIVVLLKQATSTPKSIFR